jgi:acetylornithine deacetylase/succinyl-diaminopimelate desuccinylase-like protein
MTDGCQTAQVSDELANQTIDLLQELIRNECVNDGTAASGQEVRNADLLQHWLEGSGLDFQRYEPTPGRVSLVSRIEGSDPAAPSLCLMGHIDVVPVNRDGWTRDPFAAERVMSPEGVDEVWGRGAVDMLNLTSSMTVGFRHLANTGFRPKGDLIFFAAADEESGSAHGAQWMADHERDAIYADYVLTENGGLHSGKPEAPRIGMNVGEKGVAWRRLRVTGTPGHGSRPFRADNALVKAAAVVQRLADYRPPARFHELWPQQVAQMGVDDETRAAMLDPNLLEQFLDELPIAALAGHFYSCTHTTFSPNLIDGGMMKTNVIPDTVDINVDVRTMPGDNAAEVQAHLDEALGDLADKVSVEIIMDDPASTSPVNTPLWDSLQRAVEKPFPGAQLTPQFIVGFTDSRVYREMGSVAYGAGLFSPELDPASFSQRFHGNDERIDVESLRLSTDFFIIVAKDMLG